MVIGKMQKKPIVIREDAEEINGCWKDAEETIKVCREQS